MTLPPKRQRPKSGIIRAPQRVWPRHRRFVRGHSCSVPGCNTGAPIDFAHLKTRGSGGGDEYGVSLCRIHHIEQHTMTVEAFGRKYGIDLWKLAEEFVARSPDVAMREALFHHSDNLA